MTRYFLFKPLEAFCIVLVFFGFVGGWILLSANFSELIIPRPDTVAVSLYESLMSVKFWQHFNITLIEVLLGFALGTTLGIGFGTVLSESPFLRRILGPYITAATAVPKFALAPILVLWFGFGVAPKAIVAGLVSFFPLMENTLVGLRSVEGDALRLFQSLRASRWQTLIKLRFPTAIPYLFAGLRVAMVFSVLGAIAGEYVGANMGLGALLLYAQGTLDTPLMFTAIIVTTALGYGLYRVVEAAEWLIFRRQRLR